MRIVKNVSTLLYKEISNFDILDFDRYWSKLIAKIAIKKLNKGPFSHHTLNIKFVNVYITYIC